MQARDTQRHTERERARKGEKMCEAHIPSRKDELGNDKLSERNPGIFHEKIQRNAELRRRIHGSQELVHPLYKPKIGKMGEMGMEILTAMNEGASRISMEVERERERESQMYLVSTTPSATRGQRRFDFPPAKVKLWRYPSQRQQLT